MNSLIMYLANYFVISQFAEARRNQQIEQLTKDRKHQHAHQMIEWKKRYLEKQNETTRRAHEDSLKHLQVIIRIQLCKLFVIECACRLRNFHDTNLQCNSNFGLPKQTIVHLHLYSQTTELSVNQIIK